MIATLLRFESRLLFRDRAQCMLAAVLATAVTLGTIHGQRWVRAQQAALATVEASESASLAANGAAAGQILRGEKPVPRGWWNNPADVRGFALRALETYAIKPPTALAALAKGQGDLLPSYIRVNASTKRGLAFSYEPANPRRLLIGELDLAFVVIFIVPLVLLAAGYDVLSSDKERGVLALVAAQPISLPKLAAVRLGLRVAALATTGTTAWLATLALGGFDFAASGNLSALATWGIAVLAYMAFWLGLALAMAARGWNSGTNALALALAWLVFVVLLPWGLNTAANLLHPMPSRVDFILAQRAATDAAFAHRGDLLARYLHDHPELQPQGTKVEQMHYTALDIATTKEVEAALAPVNAQFERQRARQQRLVDRWQFLSPAVLTQQALVELAGNGWSRHRTYRAQVDNYIGALQDYFYPRILSGKFDFDRFADWPRYQWVEPAATEGQRRVATAGVSLLVVAMLLAAAGGQALRRYPVTR